MGYGGRLDPGWLISAVAGIIALVALATGRVSLLLPVVAVAGLAFGVSSLFHTHRTVRAIGRVSALLCIVAFAIRSGPHS